MDELSDTHNPDPINFKLFSAKASFMVRIHSGIADYSLSFNLLQFHFDRWFFRTVSGAVNTAKNRKCSPNKGLELKMFHPTFWKNQLSILYDAMRIYGDPTFFITMSPHGWSFPYCEWLTSRMNEVHATPTKLGILQTLSIYNVLNEIINPFLIGNSNRKTW